MSTPRRLRVAVLNRNFGAHFGGAERYSVALVEQLASRHEVHVFAQQIEHQAAGVTYHRVSRPFSRPRWINQLWFAAQTWWMTRKGFDVVHSHENTWHGQIQSVHVRPFRVGVFYGLSPWQRAIKWLSILTSPRLISYWWLEGARLRPMPNRRIVASSDAVYAETRAAYPASEGRMNVIPPGVHLPVHDASEDTQNKAASRIQLGLPVDVTIALFVGNDYEKKGLPALFEAMRDLPDEVHLAVVGQAAHIPAFRKRAENLAIAPRIHFLGSLRDMEPAYNAADLLVHPTTEDTYAMVVLEALAHGLPVVVSAATYCGISAELVDGDNAVIVDNPRKSSQIKQGISRVLADQDFAVALGAAGRRFAAERDWGHMANRYEALYLTVADLNTES